MTLKANKETADKWDGYANDPEMLKIFHIFF
jgi:hypothetical protein